MSRLQYRLRPTNLPWTAGEWHDAEPGWVSVQKYSDLQIRRKPRRSLVAAVLRRTRDKQQQGDTP